MLGSSRSTIRTALADFDYQAPAQTETRQHGRFFMFMLTSAFAVAGVAGYLWKTIGLEFHFSANVWPPKEGNQEDRVTLATGLLSFRQLGSVGFHPSLDPATKLLCISSIRTTFGRILHLKGFEALNPLRINEPIKSSPSYMYQFHLSILFALHNCNSIARHST